MAHELWTKKELATIKEGKDKVLITEFLNEKTFLENEIKVYPYHLRRTYQCTWNDGDEANTEILYATDDNSLRAYIQRHYTHNPIEVIEVITDTREVSIASW